MQAKNILVPTDFSGHGSFAVAQASALARIANAKLWILYVKEAPDRYTDTGFAGYPVTEDDDETCERLLHEITATDPNVVIAHRMLSGHPADEIVRFAAENEIDLIVMGTHGRTGLTRLLMGSVAEAVVQRAHCPVLTVKNTQPAAAGA